MRHFEGGDQPDPRCWASKDPFSLNPYVDCDNRDTALSALGLCPKHQAEILGAQPALLAPGVPSAA